MMGKIIIKGIDLYGYHGVNETEKAKGQRFVIDVVIKKELALAARSDNINDTVSYSQVIKDVKEAFNKTRCNLIESVAQNIADAILNKHSEIKSIEVTVKKPDAPIKAKLLYAAVSIKRKRR